MWYIWYSGRRWRNDLSHIEIHKAPLSTLSTRNSYKSADFVGNKFVFISCVLLIFNKVFSESYTVQRESVPWQLHCNGNLLTRWILSRNQKDLNNFWVQKNLVPKSYQICHFKWNRWGSCAIPILINLMINSNYDDSIMSFLFKLMPSYGSDVTKAWRELKPSFLWWTEKR